MAKNSNDSKTLSLIEEPAKRGRPKQSELSRGEQTRLAQKRYRERQKEKLMTLSKSEVDNNKNLYPITLSKLEEENRELMQQNADLMQQNEELLHKLAVSAEKPELYALIKKTCKYHYQNPEQPFLITLSGTLGNNMPWEGNGNEYGLGDLDYYVKDHSGKLRKMLTATNKD